MAMRLVCFYYSLLLSSYFMKHLIVMQLYKKKKKSPFLNAIECRCYIVYVQAISNLNAIKFGWLVNDNLSLLAWRYWCTLLYLKIQIYEMPALQSGNLDLEMNRLQYIDGQLLLYTVMSNTLYGGFEPWYLCTRLWQFNSISQCPDWFIEILNADAFVAEETQEGEGFSVLYSIHSEAHKPLKTCFLTLKKIPILQCWFLWSSLYVWRMWQYIKDAIIFQICSAKVSRCDLHIFLPCYSFEMVIYFSLDFLSIFTLMSFTYGSVIERLITRCCGIYGFEWKRKMKYEVENKFGTQFHIEHQHSR